MVMGAWAAGIIRSEFGTIPEAILTDPPHLDGHRFHVAGAESQTLEWHTPLAWRKDLDFWLLQQAGNAGVGILEGARVVRVTEEDLCRVTISRRGVTEDFRSRFVIGADGAASVVRRSLFPELKVRYTVPIRECYRGKLDLEKDYIHWFFPRGRMRPRFNVNHKDDVFLIEGGGIKELRREIAETLAPYGFDAGVKPEWKDACVIAQLHQQLLTRTFSPAQGNVLLIGDAAGFILPVTFEGIGTALKSGLSAAESVIESVGNGKEASSLYLNGIKDILGAIGRLCSIRDDPAPESIPAAYRETLVIQNR
jgi:flavin-dependent dehydrogenase